MELVFMNNDRPITTSRLIAEKFGKQHSHVLRDIRNLDCSNEFNASNFGLVEYKDKKGEIRNEYHITRDGFTFLVMGFTGKQASKFKEEYINAFNQMEKQLKEPKELSTLELLEIALKNEKEKIALQSKVDKLEPKATMYDRVLNDNKLLKIGDVAKLFKMQGIGRNNMFKELRNKGLLYGREPYQQYINRGYFEVKLTTYTNPKTGELVTDKITLVTKKGFDYLAKLFNVNVPDSEILKYANK